MGHDAITDRDDFTALIRVGRRKLVLRNKLLEWLEMQSEKTEGGV